MSCRGRYLVHLVAVLYTMANEVSIDSVDNAPSGRPNIKVKTKY